MKYLRALGKRLSFLLFISMFFFHLDCQAELERGAVLNDLEEFFGTEWNVALDYHGLEERSTGDINGDGVEDLAIMVTKGEDRHSEKVTLFILEGRSRGGLTVRGKSRPLPPLGMPFIGKNSVEIEWPWPGGTHIQTDIFCKVQRNSTAQYYVSDYRLERFDSNTLKQSIDNRNYERGIRSLTHLHISPTWNESTFISDGVSNRPEGKRPLLESWNFPD